VKRSFGELPPKKGLLLDPSTAFLFVMMTFISLGRVFGGLRFL
jgi:hypothetical protein